MHHIKLHPAVDADAPAMAAAIYVASWRDAYAEISRSELLERPLNLVWTAAADGLEPLRHTAYYGMFSNSLGVFRDRASNHWVV